MLRSNETLPARLRFATTRRFQLSTKGHPMAGPQYVYVMKGLSKTYPGGKQVLKDIWLSFYPGAKIGIVGVNGSGKSTLMRLMAGQDKEFTGEAWAADGIRTGYLPQE